MKVKELEKSICEKCVTAVEDGNIFVAHIARCGNANETTCKPLKTAA